MNAETIVAWLAAGEGEHTDEAYAVAPCPGLTWADLDEATLR